MEAIIDYFSGAKEAGRAGKRRSELREIERQRAAALRRLAAAASTARGALPSERAEDQVPGQAGFSGRTKLDGTHDTSARKARLRADPSPAARDSG